MHIKQKRCVKWVWFFLPLFAWSVVRAEVVSPPDDYVVQVWDTDSGLPHSTVTGVAQTPDGYIWIGTRLGGLSRFDGSRFVNFHPSNTPELRSIEIHKLLVDDNGTLWIGVVDGSLDSYRNRKFCFEFEDADTPASWLNGVVSSSGNPVILSSFFGRLFSRTPINGTNKWDTFQTPDFGGDPCQDRDGAIWYRTSEGHLGKIIGKTVVRLDNPPGLRSPNVNRLLKDNSGRLWVGTDKEIAVWDGKLFVDMNPTNGEPDFAVRDLAFCPDGSLWVRMDNRLRRCVNLKWLAEAKPWDGQFPPSMRSLQMFGDNRNGVWVIHYGQGLWHVDGGGHVLRVGEQQGLPTGFVECWCEDREGNFWVGMRDSGLACIRPRIFHVVAPAEGWGNTSMRSICEDADGAMWFGVTGPTVFRWFDGGFAGLTPPSEPLPSSETSVLPDGPGRLWVGTVQNGLWLLANGVFKRPFSSGSIDTVLRCQCRDHTGALWIGSEFGLSRWDKGVLKCFAPTDGFSSAYVLSIIEDQTGDIWIGTSAGELRRWHLGKFESFQAPNPSMDKNISHGSMKANQTPPRGYSFGQECFWALHVDDEGVLWIGTTGDGLLHFKDGYFTRFTTRDGLPNGYVSQILEDDRGQLWLGTRAGIVRVVKRELTNFANDSNGPINFITYGRSDGLPTTECSGGIQPACWRSRDGRLWFSTAKGPVWVDPSALHFNHRPPPVQFEEVLVDGNRISDETNSSARLDVPVPDKIRIPPGRHYFEFKFTALSFTAPDRVKFQWRLKGLEADWVDGGNRRTVSYSFLQAGNYQFEVRACNNDGIWGQTDTSVALTVLPFFWETWWFAIVMTLVLVVGTALSVALVLRARHRRRLARLEVLRATELERSRIARDLHDELGSGLTEVTMLTAPFPGANFSIDKLHNQLQRVGERAHAMVDALDEIVWAVDPRKDNLPALARYFVGYVEGYLKESNIACMVRLPVTFPPVPVSAEVRHQLFLAMREAVTNAVRHAQPSQIGFAMELDENRQLKISITDNGCGFDPVTVAAGNGLANLRFRLDSLVGHCEIITKPGTGTTVTLVVRLPKESQNV